MTLLRIEDLACSEAIEVQGDWRLADILNDIRIHKITHAAVHEGEKFLGLIRLQDILLLSADRIFADLVPERTPTISSSSPVDDIRQLFSDSSIDAIAVLDNDGHYVSIVRRQDFVHVLFQQTKVSLTEKQDLLEKSKLVEEKLKNAQQELESRVRERTTELSQVNEQLMQEINERHNTESALMDSHHRLETTLSELKNMQNQVIQQERLRALGQMASGIAHDLNNTLSPVIAYTEIVLLDECLSEETRRRLEFSLTGANDAAKVISRLRTFYAPENDASYESVHLPELLSQMVELTRPKWKDEAQKSGRVIDFKLKFEDEVSVLGSPSELREVFTNLIFNAVDSISMKGEITLRLTADRKYAVVEVSDTGSGMTEEVASRCFEPFFTTKKVEGTGLGMSICHGIIQRHSGTCEVETNPGQGTTIRILLPLTQQTTIAEPKFVRKSQASYRVLYIDDDERVRDTASILLEHLGHQVDVASDGYSGLDLFRSSDYDVVMTDLGMPGIDGHEVTRLIKSINRDIPVIIVTGWGSSNQLPRIDPKISPDGVLPKPFTMIELQSTLEKLLVPSESVRDSYHVK